MASQNIYIVYAQENAPFFRKLNKSIKPLFKDDNYELINYQLKTGITWTPSKIKKYHNGWIVLLISPVFMTLKYNEELIDTIKKCKRENKINVLTVIIEPCLWETNQSIRRISRSVYRFDQETTGAKIRVEDLKSYFKKELLKTPIAKTNGVVEKSQETSPENLMNFDELKRAPKKGEIENVLKQVKIKLEKITDDKLLAQYKKLELRYRGVRKNSQMGLISKKDQEQEEQKIRLLLSNLNEEIKEEFNRH